jgi:hypothetical protein
MTSARCGETVGDSPSASQPLTGGPFAEVYGLPGLSTTIAQRRARQAPAD